MTPKEKAKELVNKYLQIYDGRVPQGKQGALICVDEIQKVTNHEIKYWQEVKQEINKL